MEGRAIKFCCCLLCFVFLSLLDEARGAKSRAGEDRANRQLVGLQKRLKKAQEEIEVIKASLTRITGELAGFEGEPACPNNVPGFYYSATTGSCYHLEPQDVFANWSEAKLTCQRLHPRAHLVSIETEEEQHYLATKWQNERGIGSVCRFWTSGKMLTGDWWWAASGVVLNNTYTNWLPVTTHDDERFSCLAVFSSEAYFWSAVACWAPHMITCEMSP